RWKVAIPWSIAAVIALIAGVAIWSLMRPEARPITRFAMVLPATEQLTGASHHQVAFSPDGQHLVYVANNQLYLRAMDELEARPIGSTKARTINPFFSPDGQWVGFWEGDGTLKKVSIRGGAPVTLCEVANPWGASWAADDRIVFAQALEGLWQVPATGGAKEPLISPDRMQAEVYHGPQILPDGKAVLLTLRRQGITWNDAQILVHSLDTGERKVLINGGTDARYVPTGHLVYAREATLLAVPFDLGRLEVTGAPVPIVEGVRQARADLTGAAQFSFSSDGSLVYIPGGIQGVKRILVWVDRQGHEEPLAAEPHLYTQPRVSPDGLRLAVSVTDSGNTDMWIYDLRRETFTRLTFDPAMDDRALWTLDGLRVVFRSTRDGGASNLFWKAADGTGQVERLTTSPNYQDPDSWSRDGKGLVFYEANSETSGDINVLSMEGEPISKPLLQTQFAEGGAAISPDGRWVAYHSNETGRREVYVRPFPNVKEGKWQISRDGGVSPVWGPEGHELFYRSLDGEAMMVVRIETEPTFVAGSPEVIFTGTYISHISRYYDISPDGQRFLMIKEAEQAEQTPTRDELIVVLNWFEELKRLVPTGE
ncbi:hypothetical protein MYX65_05620, partial [Acidobacteria bacterium AH-259-L09]|nr:hypothetical protein [Acidobacteria bacterium AH-259-L09]